MKIRWFLLALVIIPFRVNALTGNVVGSIESDSVIVGNTTTVTFKTNALSANITSAIIEYSKTNGISISNVSLGMTKQASNGTKYAMTGNLGSGKKIISMNVKCNTVGTNSITLDYDIGNTTSNIENSTMVNLTCRVKTALEIQEEEAARKAALEKEEEEALQASKQLSDATSSVDLAETNLIDADYEYALNLVNLLPNGTDKTSLLERLDIVKFDIAVKKEVKKALDDATIDCNCACESIDDNNNSDTKWIILASVLGVIILICLVTIGLLINKNKKISKTVPEVIE